MPVPNKISDKGLSVLAFAVYHQLESGQQVTQVIRDDGAGHQADSAGVDELHQLGMLDIDGGRVTFTGHGSAVIGNMIERMREAASAVN